MQNSKTGFCTSNFYQPRKVLDIQKCLYSGTFGIKAELMVILVRGSEQSCAAEVSETAGSGAGRTS